LSRVPRTAPLLGLLAFTALFPSGCSRSGDETRFLNFDPESSAGALASGWSGFEKTGEGDTFAWSQARTAVVRVSGRADGDRLLRFRCWPFGFEGSGPQTTTVLVNGAKIDSVVLRPGPAVYSMMTPKAVWKSGRNDVTFQFTYAEAPKDRIPGATDTRTLSAGFDWIEILPPLPQAAAPPQPKS